MMKNKTLTEKYFEDVYAADDDPWDFETSEYEAEKYAATLQALPRENYKNAFEIGCSIGVLTEMLAERCEKLLAVDVSEKALVQARERCRKLPQVRFQKMNAAQEFPQEKFDLILISEVGYYLASDDWRKLAEKIFLHLQKKAHAALIHWLPKVADYPQMGDEVHDNFAKFAVGKMQNLHSKRHENYRLDIWEKL